MHTCCRLFFSSCCPWEYFVACVQGSEFTVERLVGPEFADVAEQYAGGALMISRLAPQDYHRFHMAVSGRIARRASIDGALYTVNPVAIRQNINVYTENKRVVRGALQSQEM